MFIGRKAELTLLKQLKNKKSASLVCLVGRRRIGKSSLIAEWGKSFKTFIAIQGLSPDQHPSHRAQLQHFSIKTAEQLNIHPQLYLDWEDAFLSLSKQTHQGETLILLDEISWMGQGDPLFSAKLKDAWDMAFKKNPQLILVLCGSVSSWIEDNILKNTAFVGRVSLTLNLTELPLPEICEFWKNSSYPMSALERMLILSVTGGVPKYLEEVIAHENAEANIIRMTFNKNGLFYNEFHSIFEEVFGRRSESYEKIILACLTNKWSPQELAQQLKKNHE